MVGNSTCDYRVWDGAGTAVLRVAEGRVFIVDLAGPRVFTVVCGCGVRVGCCSVSTPRVAYHDG